MAAILNLISSEAPTVEKRVLPRFPLNFLLFKQQDGEHAFEIVDISYTGMQLINKGQMLFSTDDILAGVIHWRGPQLAVKIKKEWQQGERLGVSFVRDREFDASIRDFLSYKNIIAGMRALHQGGVELPVGLKYWLRSEGPVELFVWVDTHSAINKVQFILLTSFVEWQEGDGIKSGKILQQRDSELPLGSSGEFVVEIDSRSDASKLEFCKGLIDALPENFLPLEVVAFIRRKLV